MNHPRTLVITPGNSMSTDIEWMKKLRFVTDVVHEEKDALFMADKNHYDFIWLNVDKNPGIDYPGIDLVYKIRHSTTMNASTPIYGFTDIKNSAYTLNPKEFGLEICVRYINVKYLEIISALFDKNESAMKNGTFTPPRGWCWLNEHTALNTFYGNKPLLKEMLKSMAFEQIPGMQKELHRYHLEQNWACMFIAVSDFAIGARYLGLNNLHDACEVFVSYHNSYEVQSLEDLYQFIMDTMDKTIAYLLCWIEKN